MHIVALGTADEKLVSGQGLKDTYVKMLSSIKGVPEGCAKGIAAAYPTIRDLYDSWDQCKTDKEKQNMLVGISVSVLSRAACHSILTFAHCSACTISTAYLPTARLARQHQLQSTMSLTVVSSCHVLAAGS